MSTNADTVRQVFQAYERKDRQMLEPLLAPEFTFTSPLDDAIDRETYFERCWPNSEHLDRFDITLLVEQGDEVIVRYVAHSGEGEFTNMERFVLAGGVVQSVEVFFGTQAGAEAEAEEIYGLMLRWAEAISNKDVAGVVALTAPDSVRYNLAPPLVTVEDATTDLETWFASFDGPIQYELDELHMETEPGLVVVYGLHHLVGKKLEGENADLWFRVTQVLRLYEGEWKIVHTHESVPFYMDGSLRAAVDLQPEAE